MSIVIVATCKFIQVSIEVSYLNLNASKFHILYSDWLISANIGINFQFLSKREGLVSGPWFEHPKKKNIYIYIYIKFYPSSKEENKTKQIFFKELKKVLTRL